MGENPVIVKSKDFALRIISLYKYMCDEKKEYVLSKQLLRSGTSIGANIVEAQCGISKKEFLSKMYIAFKECRESLYWLDLLFTSGFITEKEYSSLKSDCLELERILSSITKTTRNNV